MENGNVNFLVENKKLFQTAKFKTKNTTNKPNNLNIFPNKTNFQKVKKRTRHSKNNKSVNLPKLGDYSPLKLKEVYINKFDNVKRIGHNLSRNKLCIDKSKNIFQTVNIKGSKNRNNSFNPNNILENQFYFNNNYSNIKTNDISPLKMKFDKKLIKELKTKDNYIYTENNINNKKDNNTSNMNKNFKNYIKNNKTHKKINTGDSDSRYYTQLFNKRKININKNNKSMSNIIGSNYKLFSTTKIINNFNNQRGIKETTNKNSHNENSSLYHIIEKSVINIQRAFRKNIKLKTNKNYLNNKESNFKYFDIDNISLSEEELTFSDLKNKEEEIEISLESEDNDF